MNKARLVLEPTSKRDGILRFSARLLHLDGSSDRLWWELPQAYGESVTSWADPWVIGLLFPIMQGGVAVHIEGKVSPSLLANLELFMKIRARWAPDKYRPVALSADTETELPAVSEPGLTVASFSGGVHSCFTLYRHARALAGRRTRKIGAAIVQHGLDVWLDQINSNQIYASLLADATAMLDSLAVPCISTTTNFQQIRLDWADAWATQQVAGSIFAGGTLRHGADRKRGALSMAGRSLDKSPGYQSIAWQPGFYDHRRRGRLFPSGKSESDLRLAGGDAAPPCLLRSERAGQVRELLRV